MYQHHVDDQLHRFSVAYLDLGGDGAMNQVKLRAGGRPCSRSFIVSTCYTTAGGKACQKLTQEQFVMVLTDCDSLFFTAVHWGLGVGGVFPCQKEPWWSAPPVRMI